MHFQVQGMKIVMYVRKNEKKNKREDHWLKTFRTTYPNFSLFPDKKSGQIDLAVTHKISKNYIVSYFSKPFIILFRKISKQFLKTPELYAIDPKRVT